MNDSGKRLEEITRLVYAEPVDPVRLLGKIASAILAERAEILNEASHRCTDAKFRKEGVEKVNEFERGWNHACSGLCDALANRRDVYRPVNES